MGKSDKTVQGYGTALSYIKRYLVSSSNVSYPKKWEDFTEEHGEGDQPRIILQRIGLWLGTTAFKIGQSNKFLSEKNKVTYYKGMKEVVKLRYPNNTLFAPNSHDWFKPLKKSFEKICKRNKIESPEEAEYRTSEPLYRDLSKQRTAVRAKFGGDYPVDCKSIAMNMVRKINDRKSAMILLEFSLCRAATARGGEHCHTRWNEGDYDDYFQAPDFDWILVKQLDRQCMLLFCDLELYCLCPFFGFGVYFLYGGLRREGVSDAKKDFVFPWLHEMHKDNVASHLTTAIRSNIITTLPTQEARDKRKKAFSTRSLRKGTMTEGRMNQVSLYYMLIQLIYYISYHLTLPRIFAYISGLVHQRGVCQKWAHRPRDECQC